MNQESLSAGLATTWPSDTSRNPSSRPLWKTGLLPIGVPLVPFCRTWLAPLLGQTSRKNSTSRCGTSDKISGSYTKARLWPELLSGPSCRVMQANSPTSKPSLFAPNEAVETVCWPGPATMSLLTEIPKPLEGKRREDEWNHRMQYSHSRFHPVSRHQLPDCVRRWDLDDRQVANAPGSRTGPPFRRQNDNFRANWPTRGWLTCEGDTMPKLELPGSVFGPSKRA